MSRFVGLLGNLFRRGYALLFAFVFIFYIGMSALPPFLMAGGHTESGELVYRGFHFLCHQYPWRSWFIGGEQTHYPLLHSEASGSKTIEEASGMLLSEMKPRTFYGTPEMGYKMAVCQRDVGIYGSMALFSLLFFLSGNRIKRVDWRLWLLVGVLPMAVDGIWQLASQVIPALPFRESTPLLRTLTGVLFGFFTCWYLLPALEGSLEQ